MPNVFEPDWERDMDSPPFRWRAAIQLPDVVEYPDSGKVAIRGVGFGQDPDALQLVLRADATADYFEGETD